MSSGREPLRVLAVTADHTMLETLRRDARLAILAHVQDVAMARRLAAGADIDAVFVDEAMAAGFIDGWSGGSGAVRPTVYLVRSGAAAVNTTVPSPDQSLEGRPDRSSTRDRLARLLRGRDEAGEGPPSTDDKASLFGEGAETSATGPVTGRPAVLVRQVVAVISPKGGVGKTFLSVNLAALLAKQTGFKVLLLELDLRSGDAAVHLDLIGSPTLADLAPYSGSPEGAPLERAVVTHEPSRLDVLLAPSRPEAAELVTSDQIRDLFGLVRRKYDFVIVDTPPDPLDPVVGECLQEAGSVIAISSLDAAALRRCRLFLENLAASDRGGAGRVRVVLNLAHEDGPVTPGRAEVFLRERLPAGPDGRVPVFVIPEDRGAIERSIFDGRPLVLSRSAHPAARAVLELAHSFCPVFGPALEGTDRKRPGLRGLVEALRKW